MTPALAETVSYVAAMPSLDSFKNIVITLVGTLVIIILVIRVTTAYAKKQWGELVTEVIAIVVIGWFVWNTDGAISTIKEISAGIFG